MSTHSRIPEITPLEILKRAHDRITRGWCRYDLYTDEGGTPQYCLLGALTLDDDHPKASRHTSHVTIHGYGTLYQCSRGHEEAIKAVARIIARATVSPLRPSIFPRQRFIDVIVNYNDTRCAGRSEAQFILEQAIWETTDD